MNKLKLVLDELAVESFETVAQDAGVGTVRANDVSNQRCQSQASCLPDTCIGQSCVDTECGCGPTEGQTCYINCTASAGTSCNAPCGFTCDGANSCNPYNSCDQTCWQGCAFSDVYPPC